MAPSAKSTEGARPPGLIQRYREELQTRHYARRTVETYEQWLRRFLRFHRMRHPREMGSAEVNDFLTHLAVELQVSASTQNQALSALLFLYRELLERDLDRKGVVRARKPRRLPVVLTEEEEDVAAYLGTALQDGESQSRVMQVLAERDRKSLYPPRQS
jgi:site-specific recombinase XerD